MTIARRGTKTLGFYINVGAEVQRFKTGGLVIWVSPLRRGSSEGLSTATLTHLQLLKQTNSTATRGVNRPKHSSSDPVHLVEAGAISCSSSRANDPASREYSENGVFSVMHSSISIANEYVSELVVARASLFLMSSGRVEHPGTPWTPSPRSRLRCVCHSEVANLWFAVTNVLSAPIRIVCYQSGTYLTRDEHVSPRTFGQLASQGSTKSSCIWLWKWSNCGHSSDICGTHHCRAQRPANEGKPGQRGPAVMRLSTLRETSVLSLRLGGRVGGCRASVARVIGGKDLVDGVCDLESTWEVGGLRGPPPSQRGIYKNP